MSLTPQAINDFPAEPPSSPAPEDDSQAAARLRAELTRAGGADPFAAAVRATPMPMVLTDPRQADNPIVFANEAFCRLTGYAHHEILGRNCRFLQGSETDPAAITRIREAVAAARPIEIDIRNYRKNGEPFWNRLLMAPVSDAAGAPAYFFASQFDATLERERVPSLESHNAALMAEIAGRLHAQQATEAQLRYATQAGRLGVWELDLRTGELTASAVCKEIFGRDGAAPFGCEELQQAVHPDERGHLRDAVAGSLATGADFDAEYRVSRLDRAPAWVQMRGQVVRDANAGSARMVGIALDITARKTAEAALRDLNATLEARVAERTAERDRMWRLSASLMLVARFDATITAVNPAWTTLLGWSAEELIGTSFLTLTHPDDAARTRAEVEKLSLGVATPLFEGRFRHKDGTYRWIAWTAVPDDRFIHAVGRDTTAEKRAAEALDRAEAQLRQAQKMEAVGQLTGGIAHDFNNLLTGIVGALELLQRRVGEGRFSELQRYASVAVTSANRAASLTQRLLAFARRQPLDPKLVDANRLLAGMADLLARTLGPSVTLDIVPAGGLWLTLCDQNQLESAFLNLAINARDAMPDGGRLTIETGNAHLNAAYARANGGEVQPGQYVAISVADTGVGMDADTAARAFEPFFTTKPIGQRTGLGLSMLYGFIRQSNGHVRLDSEAGRGTIFRLYLPRQRGAQPGEATADDGPVLGLEGGGEKVLVVEDEPAVRMVITEVLHEMGYAAIEAVDGASGLRVLRAGGVLDLLITDVGLPGGISGRQLADAARSVRPGLKVLFITGYAGDDAGGNDALDDGMEILTKPFAMDALATKVRGMLLRMPG